MSSTLPARLAALVTALATALVIVAVAIPPFLTPTWVGFEQGRTGAAELTGFSGPELERATSAVLRDLLIGGDFEIDMGPAGPLLAEREIAHMRDVRGVFAWFGLLALVAAAGLVALHRGSRRLGHPERWWSSVAAGARWLLVAIVLGGIVTVVAFEAAFEVFHRLFFAGGSYTFDPRTDRLVQLFPFDFWLETTLAIGVVVVVLAIGVAVVAGRRARRAVTTDEAAAGSGAAVAAEATR